MQQVQIGLAGMGNVGAGVYKNLANNRVLLMERIGAELTVKRIVVRDPAKAREVQAPGALFTTRWEDLLEDPEIQVVVELMGGMHPARELVLGAIERGKMVVTGNKALLAEHGREIFEAAATHKVPVFFEAAAAGGVPIIKAIREAFIGNHILSIHGIVNGTSNYILTRMTESGLGFAEALREAQAAGYAEADPTLDVNGWDAAHKAIILASLAYGFWVGTEKVYVEGIEKHHRDGHPFRGATRLHDQAAGDHQGGQAERDRGARASDADPADACARLGQRRLQRDRVHGDIVGDTLFYGRGAGQDPTSSAVISDLAEAAAALQAPRSSFGFTPHGLYGTCKPIDQIVSQYYLHISVDDEPGVLAQVAGILGGLRDRHFLGHPARGARAVERAAGADGAHGHRTAQMQLRHRQDRELACVKRPPRLIRVETFSA